MSAPLIIIPSIGQSMLYMTDENGKRVKDAWPFELDKDAFVNELKGSLMKTVFLRIDGGFSDRVAIIVEKICEPFELNNDGERVHNIAVSEIKHSFADCTDNQKKFICNAFPADSVAEAVGGENIFYFAYDFLEDPKKEAQKLDKFISEIKTKNGCEKVSLAVLGTGGVVAKSYMTAFANKNCFKNVVFVSAALDGMTIAADLTEDRLNFENPAERFSSVGGKVAYLAKLTETVPAEVTAKVVKKSLTVLNKKILNNSVLPWHFMPTSRFHRAIISCDLSDSMRDKAVAINDNAKAFTDCVKSYMAGGTEIKFFSGNGKKLPPVVTNVQDSDGVIDTFSSSFNGLFPDNTVYYDCNTDEFMKSELFLSYIKENL